MNIPFVDLKKQYLSIKPEIDRAIGDVLENCAFSGGPFVESFEKHFAAAHNSKHCIAASSGTSALHLAVMALGIGPGAEVVLPANTFIATAEAVSLAGATPVFVDCDPLFYNIDPASLESAITPATQAIIPVHLYGQPAPMDEIKAIASAHKLWLIEDCAQAHLALYKGRPVGTEGILGWFSFYPGKNLGAYGEGGAVVTNDEDLCRRVRALRNHGSEQRYLHQYIGHNYRMEGFQGAILDVKLKYIDDWTRRRIHVAESYRHHLAGVRDVRLPEQAPDVRHVYHLFVVRVPDRDRLIQHLTANGIATGIHYPLPCHLQGAYKTLGYQRGSLPISEAYASQILSLPMFPEMDEEKVAYVAEHIRTFYKA